MYHIPLRCMEQFHKWGKVQDFAKDHRLKFIYSEKGHNLIIFDKISKFYLKFHSSVKTVWRFCHIFVVFSKYMNFINVKNLFWIFLFICYIMAKKNVGNNFITSRFFSWILNALHGRKILIELLTSCHVTTLTSVLQFKYLRAAHQMLSRISSKKFRIFIIIRLFWLKVRKSR